MEKEFLQYTESLALRELGFDEECLGVWICKIKELHIGLDSLPYNNKNSKLKKVFEGDSNFISAPTYSQAFRWFRDKYDLNSLVVFDKYICEIDDKELENPYFTYYYSINELWSEGKDYGKFTRGFINVASNRDMLSYEEAELDCLKKLIEIVKEK